MGWGWGGGWPGSGEEVQWRVSQRAYSKHRADSVQMLPSLAIRINTVTGCLVFCCFGGTSFVKPHFAKGE